MMSIIESHRQEGKMPRPQRAPDEVNAVKQGILETALTVLNEDGYIKMSMNKVAERTGMTAANLYNYFANKDELILALQTRITERIYGEYQAAYARHDDPFQRLEAFVKTLMHLGIHHPNDYDLLFSITAPRFQDYVGTNLEPVARTEKQRAYEIAVKIREIYKKVVLEISERHGSFGPGEVSLLLDELWCTVHGAVMLYNRNFLSRFSGSDEAVVYKICESALERFRPPGGC
jgi:AcrR family transcriptional regulator